MKIAYIDGARGNSGAILAQFLQSLAHELGSEARIGAKRLAQGALIAAEKTRAALSSPREGTILTVLHDWAQALHDAATHCDDISQVFHSSLDAAKASLERTRNFLPEMRRAGVVDAGAKGFIHLLDGVAELLKPGMGPRSRIVLGRLGRVSRAQASLQAEIPAEAAFSMSAGGIDDSGNPEGPRYCTEALLHDVSIPLDSIRERLSGLGKSIVVAGDEEIARVHVHSDRPSAVFDLLESAGRVEQHKVDDMELQPLITIGGITRPDGAAMELESIHSRMTNDPGFSMSTSQPVESAFVRAFTLALSQADEALYIGLTSALSGTFQAGEKAAEGFGGRVRCIDSKTITAGAGAITALAVERAEAGASAEEFRVELESKREKNAVSALFARIRRLISSDAAWTIHIVHVAAKDEAEKLADLCRSQASAKAEIFVSDMGPLLSSIAWLGAIGVAVVPRT